jgi:hypothetical protein
MSQSNTAKGFDGVLFTPAYYLCHLFLIAYILCGFGIQFYSWYANDTFRTVSVATWPWVLSSNRWIFFFSILIQTGVFYYILRSIRERIEDFKISIPRFLPITIYVLCLLIQYGRFFVLMIAPAGIAYPQS